MNAWRLTFGLNFLANNIEEMSNKGKVNADSLTLGEISLQALNKLQTPSNGESVMMSLFLNHL